MKVSNPDKVMFPDRGLTKADLVGYYESVADQMAPMLVGRPLTLHRFPSGLSGKGFMQKNAGKHFPASIRRYEVPKQRGGVTTYPVITGSDAIAWLANQGSIAFHIWLSTVSQTGDTDADGRWLVLDLDPPAGQVDEVMRVAMAVAAVLADFSLSSVPVMTGSKGIHVWVPVSGGTPGRIALANRALAGLVVQRVPDVATTEFLRRERQGKVFVDWLRTNPQATVVAPLSVRATPSGSVAVPIDWDELDSVRPDEWTLTDADVLMSRPSFLARAAVFNGAGAIDETVVGQIEAAARQAKVDLDTPFDRFGRM